MRLSILDQSPVGFGRTPAEARRESVSLARELDGRGYIRYWLAEHHRSPSFAGSAPDVLAHEILTVTSQLRVGTGGVMLALHSEQNVAEAFAVLAALHPGRIDLGIGRSGDRGGYAEQALRLRNLLGFRADGTTEDGMRLWMLGAGGSSAPLAAELGAGYAHAAFLDPFSSAGAIAHYRRALPAGPAILAVRVVAAADEDRARMLADSIVLWRSRKDLGADEPIPTADAAGMHRWSPAETSRRAVNEQKVIWGTPAQLGPRLEALAAQHGVDELMITTPLGAYEERLSSFQLLAEALKTIEA